MKKIIFLLPALMLSACATSSDKSSTSQLGSLAFKKAVNAKCAAELNNIDAWRIGTKLMTKSQKKRAQSQVCGCVTQKAPYSAANAVVNSSTYNAMVANAVVGTIDSCVLESFK